jgi:hypothetical protein
MTNQWDDAEAEADRITKLSDEDLMKELIAQGVDIDKEVKHMREVIDYAILRQKILDLINGKKK